MPAGMNRTKPVKRRSKAVSKPFRNLVMGRGKTGIKCLFITHYYQKKAGLYLLIPKTLFFCRIQGKSTPIPSF